MPDNKNVPADLYKGDNFLEDVFFPDVEANIARRERERRPKRTPHSLLKQAVISAIRKLATPECRPIIVPQFSGRISTDSGKRYKAGQPGVSDLLVIWHGQAFGLELKYGSDRQRHSQQHWQALFERAGGIYLIVRKPSEAIDAMTQWAAQRGKLF